MMCPASANARLDFAGDRRIESREHQLAARGRAWRPRPSGRATSSGKRPGSRHAAASRYALPSDRWLAPEPLDPEPRVIREQGDELLADHAGRAKDTDGNRRHRLLDPKKKPTRKTVSADVLARLVTVSQRSSTTPPTRWTRFLRPSRFRASEKKTSADVRSHVAVHAVPCIAARLSSIALFNVRMLNRYFTPGSGGSRRSRPIASSGRSNGGSTGFRANGHPRRTHRGRDSRRVGRRV